MSALLWLLEGCNDTTRPPPVDQNPESSTPETDQRPGSCGTLDGLARLEGPVLPEALAPVGGGDVYFGGEFAGTFTLGDAADAPRVTNLCSTGDSAFLGRTTSPESGVWVRAAQGCSVDTVSLASGAGRVSWLTYRRHTGVDFEGGGAPGVHFEEHGPIDIAVATYTSGGDLLWAADVGGGGYKAPVDLALGPDGAAYAVGTYQGEPMVFGPGREDVLLPYDPRNDPLNLPDDGFLAKWNADGTFAWAVGLVGADQQQPGGVSVLDDGTVVVTGRFYGGIEVAPGTPNATYLQGNENSVGFVAAFTPAGDLAWAQRWGGFDSGAERVQGGGASSGRVAFVAGTVEENPSFGPAWPGASVPMSTGEFAAGWRSDGEVAFVRDLDDGMAIFALDVDPLGRMAIGGIVDEPITFGAPPEATIVLSTGLRDDPVVLTYAEDGSEQCAWHVLSDREDFYEHVTAVAFDGAGGVWATGIFQGELVFAHGTPEETTLKNLFGEWSTWIARFELDAGGSR